MDGPGPTVVRADRFNRLGHTAVRPGGGGPKLLYYRVLMAAIFSVTLVALPLDISSGARAYVVAVVGLYVPWFGVVVHRRFDGDRADFATSLSDIVVSGLCCVVIPGSSSLAAIAITAVVVVAIPVQPRRLVAVLAITGVLVGGALAYRWAETDDWYLQPLVMAGLFPAFDLYLRDRRRQWDESAKRYEALIHASEVFFWEIDVATKRFVTAVGNCKGLLGYEPTDLVGRRWTDFLTSDDIAEVAKIDHRLGRRSVTTAVTCRNGQSRIFRHTVDREPGSPIVFGVSADISELAEATEVIRIQAERDHLTGLSNRMVLLRQLDRVVAQSDASNRSALFILDLNRFKEVNDTLGHPAGDRLLQELAERLEVELSDAAVVARLGGDEFAVLIDGLDTDTGRVAAVEVAGRIHVAFQRPVDIDGVGLVVTPSIGIALIPEHGTTVEDVIRCADVAMYESKRSGRSFVIYHEDPGQLTLDRLLLGTQISRALDRGEFDIWYHLRMDLRSGDIVGVEAEPRWCHPDQGVLASSHYVELLDLAGELTRYGGLVVTGAVGVIDQLDRAGLTAHMALAVPAGCLLTGDWMEATMATLEHHGVDASRFTIRLTDIASLGDRIDQVRLIRQLADAGFGVAAEELAAPSGSPSAMRELPITEVKLDADFVAEMGDHSQNLLVARALIELGQLFGRTVVADGVTDQATVDRIRSLGCHLAQGSHVARPMAERELIADVRSRLDRSNELAH